MSGRVMTRETQGAISPYFFLSYAHSDSLAAAPEANPDELVGEFYGDLADAVTRFWSRPPGFVPGFYDQQILVGSDWKQSMSRVMGTAQVFVALYSPAYIDRWRPGQEWACFRRRVELAGLRRPEVRFVPLIWTPLPEGGRPPELFSEALALGASQPGYTANGLRALLKIGPYRESYEGVVNNAAKRVVTLAEQSPITPSEVPDIDEMKSPFADEPQHLSVFVIETAAPTRSTVIAEHGSRGYGEASSDWRPFAKEERPLAEYAAEVARRLSFKPEISGIKTVKEARNRRPGIIVIDPWFIADDGGRAALEWAVRDLPRWVLPLVVLDRPRDTATQKLAYQVKEILRAAGALPTDSAREAAKGVTSLDEFVSQVRVLVVEAERQYLRYRSGRYRSGRVTSPPASTRPSLRHPARPGGLAAPQDGPTAERESLGETPDA